MSFKTWIVITAKEGYETILLTGTQCWRSVLLTTIAGLTPRVMELNFDLIGRKIESGGPSTQWWSQHASVEAADTLAFATVQTLIIILSLMALATRRQSLKTENLELSHE